MLDMVEKFFYITEETCGKTGICHGSNRNTNTERTFLCKQTNYGFIPESSMKFLSRQEELLLLSIWKLGEKAYGVTIRLHVSEVTRKYWSIGAIYDVLDRLQRKGFVTTVIGEPTKARGGKSKRFYRITKSGFEALEEVQDLQKKTWADLPEPAIEK
jgi:DNA-binding PadR family transcriptional regulator